MSWGERERADANLEFSSRFSVVSYLFAGFVFTGSHLVWNPFSEPTQKWRPQLSTIFTLPCLVFTRVFTSSRPAANSLSNPSRSLTSAWCRKEDIPVSGGSPPAQKIWNFRFFPFIFNYRCNLPVTSWPATRSLSWPTIDSLLFLLIIFSFLSLSLSLSL